MGSAICSGQLDAVWLKRLECPSCDKRRFFVRELWQWYGVYDTCLKCGEKFCDGVQMDRPFCRGWRRGNIKAAERFYRKYRTVT